MRLTAMDIRQQQFAIKLFRGLDPQEVDAFLEEIAEDWDQLTRENNLLKEQLVSSEDQKKTLQEALIVAQKMAEEYKENSRRAADIVMREAQLQAEKLLEEGRQEHGRVTTELAALKQQRRQLAEELLATLRMHQRLVEQKLADGT